MMTLSFLVAATSAAPAFFAEISLLLVTSALVAYICHRLRIMPIVSFLLTGALIGPNALGWVRDEALIEAAAELGVILLLFTIGIEFSLEKLARIQRLIFIGGGAQVALAIGLVTGLLWFFDVGWQTGLYTGCLVALSSTAVVMKLLMSRGETNSEGGQASLGILIFQDLAVVGMVLVVPMLGGQGGSGADIAIALGKAAGIVALVLVVARRVMPKVLEAVARTCSQEIFLLTVVGICFGTAYLTSLAGVSLALGAFLAGLVVSESRFSEMAFGEILPFQILFSATFFVSVGLLFDPRFLLARPWMVIGIICGVLVIKLLATGVSLRILGYGSGTIAFAGLMLAQVGEFSFVLERTGRSAGLTPAGLEQGGSQAFIGATVILMIATPFLATLGELLRRRATEQGAEGLTETQVDFEPEVGNATHDGLEDHVVIAGYGEAGQTLARAFKDREIPFLILTLSPEGATEAEREKLKVLRGNYTRQHELSMAGARRARALIVADDDLETTRRVVRAAHAINPDLRVLARTRFSTEIEELREAGAGEVVAEDRESVVRLMAMVLDSYDVPDPVIHETQEAARRSADPNGASISRTRVRLSERQRNNQECSHIGRAQVVVASSQGCNECLEKADSWVHLRVCMTCGQVGCCDSSKNQHASKHSRNSGHAIVKSFEPGENWAWCYIDEIML
jgi:CPA2 family monovalent cation:H+ antiporter-2